MPPAGLRPAPAASAAPLPGDAVPSVTPRLCVLSSLHLVIPGSPLPPPSCPARQSQSILTHTHTHHTDAVHMLIPHAEHAANAYSFCDPCFITLPLVSRPQIHPCPSNTPSNLQQQYNIALTPLRPLRHDEQ